MSELDFNSEVILDQFRTLYEDFFERKRNDLSFSSSNEDIHLDLLNYKNFLIGVLENIYSRIQDSEETSNQVIEYSIFNEIFSETIELHCTKEKEFDFLLGKTDFNLYYGIFKHFNPNLRINKKALKIFEQNLVNNSLNPKWFDLSILKTIYNEIPYNEKNEKFLLRSLILKILRRNERKITDIKLLY